MKQTLNYGLNLFEGSDKVSLSKMNENTDKLDKTLKGKQNVLTGATNQLVGFNEKGEAAPVNYAVVHTPNGQLPARLLVRPAKPLVAGPNQAIPGPHYVRSFADGSEFRAYDSLHETALHCGRYSYSHSRFRAYRLDNITREAELLVDLLPDDAEGEYDVAGNDTIIAVDEQYIYFAQHAVNSNPGFYSDAKAGGRILRYDHAGKLLETGPYSGDRGWLYNMYRSISTDNEAYRTIFYRISTAMENVAEGYDTYGLGGVTQTKNFIVIWYCGERSASGYLTGLTFISKTTLKTMTTGSGTDGGVSFKFTSWDASQFCAVYNGDGLYYKDGSSYANSFFVQLTTSATNGYSLVGNTNTTATVSPGPRKDDSHFYYVVHNWSDGACGVITEDEIDFSTGKFTLLYPLGDYSTYLSADALRRNYDPIKGDFSYRDAPYTVYPTYSAPATPTALPSGLSETVPFKVDDYFYFRDASYNIFRVKNETQYMLDRAEVIE